MVITSKQVLNFLYILSWIIFVGVCVEAGGFMFNAFYTLVINPVDAAHFWPGINFSSLYSYDHGYFLAVTLAMSIVAVLRCWLFYLIVKLLHGDKLNMAQPFNKTVGRFIFNLSYVAFIIGAMSWWGSNYADWLAGKGVVMPGVEHLRLAGADVWLFMGVILFVIAHIFKRGIEIQSENELTV
ncbi:MAG TPA: DUF2975 domain-containing protein [Chitinophagaceae bacterium]|nr:DUF2975 domain-containing protein [Chitinophagaceae bacterium]